MNYLVEILIALILIFLVIGQPTTLSVITHTLIGKIVFIILFIMSGLYSTYAGILVALIYIILHKRFRLVENMENSDKTESIDFVKKYCKDNVVDKSLSPPDIRYKNNITCNPCEPGCEFEITSSQEQLTTDETLRPKESNALPL